ncbi:MAG: hypothetical protein IKP08_00340 [Bacteroidales bacterium]|nr:hypothetical protein [Bacteroidales bacterium]
MDYKKLREEPLKSAVQQDFFKSYKYTQIGNIDFVIAKHNTEKGISSLFEEFENDELKSILWAEAKQGTNHDIYESFVQLILTIGKERTFEKYLPPKYIGAFDAEKFAFIEYHSIQDVFYRNDFNWNVTPSNHETKEFKLLHTLCENLLQEKSIIFRYETDSGELKEFIRLNFKTNKDVSEKISVTKNNFTFVFQKWSDTVKPTISVDWDKAQKAGLISADFFLADLLSSENESLKDSLYVVLKKTKYELAKTIDDMGLISVSSVGFNDKQKAYKEFWAIYERPPKEEYWDYIIGRRDLLVPQDIRERKGSFFTPQIWVEKSQQYLADVLGETWQDEYYIWDCCAGTGNLLNGLSNYRNVWASTLDKQDVDVMKDRIANGWNMFENHIFQFDFLNDDFSKCPEELQEILNDDEKRKRLVIYINPPYAEAANRETVIGSGKNKINVAVTHKTYSKYLDKIGIAGRELFAQFFIRIYCEIPHCVLAEFSTLKILQAPNFKDFRAVFKAKLEKSFLIPANTFDNVNGKFPIGFFIWDCGKTESFNNSISDVYNADGSFYRKKLIDIETKQKSINDWIITTRNQESEQNIGYMSAKGADFQNQNYNFIINDKTQLPHPRGSWVTDKNIIEIGIYLSVRQVFKSDWLNDRDQFLFPNDDWKTDKDFQVNCLIYTLFHGQNRISCTYGTNHWIPFTEAQVGCKKAFKSNFMSKFINGEIDIKQDDLFSQNSVGKSEKLVFSPEAQSVYNSGLELWKYYHAQPNANPNASFYDIRKYFQGEKNGRMNNDSNDSTYTELIADLRAKMKLLAKKIEPKVYEYGFLK